MKQALFFWFSKAQANILAEPTRAELGTNLLVFSLTRQVTVCY